MDRAKVSQDDYQVIIGLLEGLNAQRTWSVDGPGMLRESAWVLYQRELCLRVIQDDAGNVSVLVNKIQLLSATRFLEIVLAEGTKAVATAAA